MTVTNQFEDSASPAASKGNSSFRPATSLSQRFSNGTGLPTSFRETKDNLLRAGKSTSVQDSQSYAPQMDHNSDVHGVANPTSFEFDHSMDYLPARGHVAQQSSLYGGQDAWDPKTGCSSLESFLQLISSERLSRMPHRASKWDRVMRVLEAVAVDISAVTSSSNAVSSTQADIASSIYAACSSLLRISSSKPGFSDFAILILAAVRRSLAAVARQKDLFSNNRGVQQNLDLFLSSLLEIINETLACGQEFATGMHLDISPFHRSISALQDLRTQLTTEVWAYHLRTGSLDSQDPVGQLSRIRQWLEPYDPTIGTITANSWSSTALHAEFTCEWFSKPLLDFLRSSDKIFCIEGPVGCGKSMLFDWIVDSFSGQVGGRDYIVLNHSINPLVPSELGLTCLLKGLLHKAYLEFPGLETLYLSLVNVMDVAVTVDRPPELIESLWCALGLVLENIARPSILIIDGVSELRGGTATVVGFMERLSDSIAKSPNVRAVLLSRTLGLDHPSLTRMRRFAIQRSHVQEDVRNVIDKTMARDYPEGRSEVVSSIMSKASGNFLWSLLMVQICLRAGSSTPLKTLPISLDATAAQLVSNIEIENPQVRTLLSCLLVAQRPLRLDEAESLLSLDMKTRTFNKTDVGIHLAIEEDCRSILAVDDGIVRFRHPIFTQATREIMSAKMKSSLTKIHANMVQRLLLYLKLVITNRSEPVLKPMTPSAVEEGLRSNKLVAYALRYWTYHYGESGFVNDSEGDFGAVFPHSTYFAALEASYWSGQPLCDGLPALRTAKKARQDILGTHSSTLQTTILLAVRFKSISNRLEAASNFATAFRFAQELLPEFHDFSVKCVTECLASVRTVPKDERLDLPLTVPDMLRFLIARYDQLWGEGNDQSLDAYQSLARHYAENEQYGLSTRVYRDIYGLTVMRFGKFSAQAKAAASDLAALVQSQKSSRSESPEAYNDIVDKAVMDVFPATDRRRIKASILRAGTFKQINPLDAELEFLNVMHGISKSEDTYENRQSLEKIGLEYASFLVEQDRAEESQSVLLGLWHQIKGQSQSVSGRNELLSGIIRGFQQAGLPAVALTVFGEASEQWEHTEQDRKELRDIDQHLSELTVEVMSSIEDGRPLLPSTEHALLHVFETAKSRGATAITPTVVQISHCLIDSFIQSRRWQDLLYIASATLQELWPAVLNNTKDAPIPDGFNPQLGDMALKIALAYSMVDEEDAAGQIYWNILRSVRLSSDMDWPDFAFASTAQAALESFEKAAKPKKMIGVAQELVTYHQKTLGNDNPETIDNLYTLAALCMDNGEVDSATKHYERIATSLQKPSYHSRRALPALEALLSIFRSRQLWDQAGKTYRSLWQTFLEKGKEYCIPENTAKALHKDYSQLLENELHAGPEAIHELCREYRQACEFAFGDKAPIALDATMSLAKSWQRRQSDSPEAINLYENIVDRLEDDPPSSRSEVENVFDEAETILRWYYSTHLEVEMDPNTLARAVRLQERQFGKEKEQLGLYSPQVLSCLATWISLLTKEGSEQSRCVAVRELQQTVDFVLQSECEGKALFDAAVILASAYRENGYVHEGLEVAQAWREQMIFREPTSQKSVVQRSKLTFLTAFESRMEGSIEDFATIHSRSLLEWATWESFQALDTPESSCEEILARGAKLLSLLRCDHPSYKGDSLQDRLFSTFMEKYKSAFTTGPTAAKIFVAMLLQSLSTESNEVDLKTVTCIAVNDEAQRLVGQQRFADLLDVCIPGSDFIRYIGAYENDFNLRLGLELGLILGDVGPGLCSEKAVNKRMLELSKVILREVLQLCRTKDFDLDSIDIDDLSKVAAVLGKQQNYHDLEWLLNQLWLSRHKRGPLSQDIIVMLGRRLVDVRFFHGHVDSAIELAEDILYNLRQVYGPSHPPAMQMTNLLASMYMSKGDRAAAMAVHEGSDLTIDRATLDIGDDADAPEESSHDDKLIRSKIEQLLQCYRQDDGFEKSGRHSSALIDDLTRRLSASSRGSKPAPLSGHRPPKDWSFAIDGEEKDHSVRFED
ncbi:hypothetical protein ACLMJK_009324 [Lecanora helva]